ncbi:putative urea carboxylase [Colletotrichum siamense]|uniref:Urea carboxylase n=1 Tax=Colletotrichum siamense TaxID=690259 RepID=A0A9P5KBC3_COLSI|nr:putative urea carboxylase [Colletotrichum siamense]KAF4866091.1 putative urea carboxylase [Colletotrichum siamense]
MASSLKNIQKVLVANRGEIAVRCIKACRELGVKTVAIYTDADATSLHTLSADEAVLLPGSDRTAYTDGDAIINIAQARNADAIIPGYGFLSENADFAAAAEAVGIIFVGPSVASIKAMGLKHEAREIAHRAGVPTVPGTALLSSAAEARENAARLGFPIMLKATGGGGGMGLQICQDEVEVERAFETVVSRAGTLFKNSGVFLEKYYPRSRHVEVQVAGNGNVVVSFGERECSLQRRHQKVIEECPSTFVDAALRRKLCQSAIDYASQLNYKSVGTVEFLVDDETAEYFFLEMNTRLQVEHGITELCYGVDLVHLMLRQADCEKAGLGGIPTAELRSLGREQPLGSAIEVRVYAEDALNDFAPRPGLLQSVRWPKSEGDDGVRVDTWVKGGQRITPYYDPLVGKIMVHDDQGREQARQKMIRVLKGTTLQGTQTNLQYLTKVLQSEAFIQGNTLTTFLNDFVFEACAIQVLEPGMMTTIQDYPGRVSVRHGVPRSGPMDTLSSQIANVLVGDEPGTELLEVTLTGPALRFYVDAVVAVCGGSVSVTVGDVEQPMWSRFVVRRGQVLKLGQLGGSGFRAYIAIRGGFPGIPLFLGSKSTAPELGYGGLEGRKLQMHDVLDLAEQSTQWAATATSFSLPSNAVPSLDIKQVWCMEGPYGDNDILTPAGRAALYEAAWKVNHNSGRSGVRLAGPQLEWARSSGGGGGSHPSNVFDYGYPVGGVNWTGDFPVIFSVDSPDAGGFACPLTICSADFWKLGQLKPGDEIRFRPTTFEWAMVMLKKQDEYITAVAECAQTGQVAASIPALYPEEDSQASSGSSTLREIPATDSDPKTIYRQGGDSSIIVEFGTQVADLRNTICVRLLAKQLEDRQLDGVSWTPSIATLTVHFNPKKISQTELLSILSELPCGLGQSSNQMPVREVQLPICLDHSAIAEAVQRYMDNIRKDASYLPDNVEYIRENNALSSRQAVFDAFLNTPWLTVAVGFYVGTPFLFPLDPKYVYVGQKYNPSRVFTPSGSVGLGGSLVAIYPVAAPGGYQLIGRTIGCWDETGNRPCFEPSKPWLFRHFDLVRFVEVGEEEYDKLKHDYDIGQYEFTISETTINMDHFIDKFDAANQDPAHLEWIKRQSEASKELARREMELFDEWHAATTASTNGAAAGGGELEDHSSANVLRIKSPVSASVWKVEVGVGDVLKSGQTVAVLEAMKMEIKVICGKDEDGMVVKSIVTDENASEIGTGVASSTASVTSSVLSYREENGRKYHAYKEGKYTAPNDEQEQDRLDLQHNLFLLTFDNALGLAPPNQPNSNVQRVLDVGTGTGIWAIDFGEDHEGAEVLGIDLSHSMPEFVPQNVRFEIDDLDEEWTYSQPFDYIHTRGMNSCIADWRVFLTKVFDNLTPGGYFELQELEVFPRSDDGTLTPECQLSQCMKYVHEAFEIFGRSFQQIPDLVRVMEDVGFVDVKMALFKWPSNTWPKDPKYKELGDWNNENINNGFVAITMAPFTRALGWTKEEVHVFLPGVRKDLNDKSIHAYWPVYVVYGMKPFVENTETAEA